MKIVLLSTESLQEIEAEAVEVTTIGGGRTIMNGHAPCIEQLIPGGQMIIHLPGGATKSFNLHNGILRVTRHELVVLLT